jgi:hypothetical protein
MITRKMLKASRFHNTVNLRRHAGHRLTTYTRKSVVVQAVSEALTLWQRIKAWVSKVLDTLERRFSERAFQKSW